MKKIHIFGAVCVLLGLLLGGLAPAGAQEHRLQTRAKVWDVYFNNGVQGVREKTDMTFYRPIGMQYPGQYWIQLPPEFSVYWGEREWGSAAKTITALHEMAAVMPGFDTFVATVVSGDYFVSESKPSNETTDLAMIAYDPSKGPEKNLGYRKVSPLGPDMANWWPGQPPPGKENVVEIHNYQYSKYMDPDKDTFPESLLITNYTTKRGIMVTKKAYGWSYPDYDDFEILEMEFENTGDSDGDGKPDLNGGAGLQLNDTFFVLSPRFMVSQEGHGWTNYNAWFRIMNPQDRDDWYKYTEAANYNGPASGKGLKMWYSYDGDNPLVATLKMGKPYIAALDVFRGISGSRRVEGELTGYQYGGFAPIAYTPSGVNDPAKFSYDTKGDSRYVASRVADQPYAVKWWDFRNRGDYDQPDTRVRSQKDVYTLLTGSAPSIQPNPTDVGARHVTYAFGPYDLKLGDKVKIVVALVAAAPVEENMWAWARLGLQAELKTDKAFNNLVKHLNKAREAFAWGYDLPDAPPDVKVQMGVTPEAHNLVRWDDTADTATHPDYTGDEAKDVKGYRVYRSDYKIDNWQLFADIPLKDPKYYKGGKYELIDEKSVAGFEYNYSVRTYSKGHSNWNGRGIAVPSLESGIDSPEQWVQSVKPFSPYVPVTAEADRLQKKVIVVPNPYKDDGAHAYPNKGRMRFLNIPSKCKIQIFTMAGDLLGEINHNNSTMGEVKWDQTVVDLVEPAPPGVYLFVVESLMPESLGQKQRGAFMIVK